MAWNMLKDSFDMSSSSGNNEAPLFVNHFPPVENDNIQLIPFLEAAKEIVRAVEKLGKLLIPVKADINGNIEKLKKTYLKTNANFPNMYDMLMHEKSQGGMYAADALLWLSRSLHFMEVLFSNVFDLDEHNGKENITDEVVAVYEQTLKKYHKWLDQKAFYLVSKAFPSRTQFLTACGLKDADEKVTANFRAFINSLSIVRNDIARFYVEKDLVPSLR